RRLHEALWSARGSADCTRSAGHDLAVSELGDLPGQPEPTHRLTEVGIVRGISGLHECSGHGDVVAESSVQLVGLVLEDTGRPALVLFVDLLPPAIAEQLGGTQAHPSRAWIDRLPAVHREASLEGVDPLLSERLDDGIQQG